MEAILAVALASVLAGCVLRGKPKTAAAPPQPQPVATASAAPPQPPPVLSIPQTQVILPPAQPINPDAVPAETQPEPPPEPTPAATGSARTNRSRPPQTNTAPKPETPPAVVAPPAPAPAVEARPPIQEVVPASEQKRLQDSAQARKRVILQWLNTAGRRRASKDHATIVRIRAFLKDSDEAEQRGDMRQADALAERAEILLRELQNGQ